MSFWFRYSVLILLCVVTPLGLGFWLDTQSQLERAKAAGEASAMAAEPALSAQLTLGAHGRVGAALQLAQSIADEKLLTPVKGALRPDATTRLAAILQTNELATGGFAWVIDETGVVVARSGSTRERDPDKITGLPLFASTQLGFALDGALRQGDALFVVGAAPVAPDGIAQGAVFVAQPIDNSLIEDLSKNIRVEVSLVQKDEVVASTLPTDIATSVVAALDPAATGPTHGGRLAARLRGTSILPLFVAHDAQGMAYSSLTVPMIGQDDARWMISVENGRALANLAERQQSILGILLAALLLAVVIGLSLSRTFVRPIEQLTDHLSGLQQGRGDREISESQVSRPFRRLAKLINMTVQRIPPGGVFGYEGERRPSADPPTPDLGAAMLSAPPPAQAEAYGIPSAMTGAAPLNVATLGSMPAGRASSAGLRPVERPTERPMDPMVPPVVPSAPSARPVSFTPSRQEAAFGEAAAADLLGSTDALDHALAAASRAIESDPGFPAAALASTSAAQAAAAAASFASPTVPAGPPAAAGSGGSKKARSASSIRGAPSTNVSQSMLDMNTSALQALGSTRPDSARGPALPDRGRMSAAQDLSSPFMGLLDEAKSPTGGFPIPPASTGSSRMGGSAAFGLGSAGVPEEHDPHSDDFKSEATVVAAPNDYLLQASARDMTASGFAALGQHAPERTLVAEVPKNLLAESKKPASDIDDPEDSAHFKETYERFVDMRRQCGEATGDLVFERFVTKLRKNREQLISKYNCRTVRFQVYEKDGKAALKATPVRA